MVAVRIVVEMTRGETDVRTIAPVIAPILGAAMLLMASGPHPAAAMTAFGSTGIRSAIETLNPVERVACWRYGWRGWGIYPGCVFRPAYVAPPVVYAAPVYPPAAGRCWINGRWRVC